nr:hypothetical protein Itr_chr05CG18250 [Ipomoea trifida]
MPQLEREFDGVDDPEPEEVAGWELFTKLQRLTDISGDGEVKTRALKTLILRASEVIFITSSPLPYEP